MRRVASSPSALAGRQPGQQAEARIAAALAAGGRLVRDEFAPSWWTRAGAAGNEVDIATRAAATEGL